MRLSLTPAVLVIGLAAVAHGAIFARLAEADPVVISAVRTGVAGLIMLPLGLATGWTAIRAGGATVLARAGLAGLFLALHFAAWIASLDHTTIVNSVILVSLSPVWLAIHAVVVGRQRLRRLTLTSVPATTASSATPWRSPAASALPAMCLSGSGRW
jgi:drug/metabolite transporter (DMT)-like permease